MCERWWPLVSGMVRRFVDSGHRGGQLRVAPLTAVWADNRGLREHLFIFVEAPFTGPVAIDAFDEAAGTPIGCPLTAG